MKTKTTINKGKWTDITHNIVKKQKNPFKKAGPFPVPYMKLTGENRG